MEEDNFIDKMFEVRVCHLKKNNINNEYGFNLKAKSIGKCQIIGKKN